MAYPVANSYTVASGVSVYAGRAAPSAVQAFDSVSVASDDGYGTASGTAPHILVVELHGSGGQNTSTGKQFRAAVSGRMAHETHTVFSFSLARSQTPRVLLLRPVDWFGTYSSNVNRELMWLGAKNIRSGAVDLISKRRLDAMMLWRDQMLNVGYDRNKTCLTGGSMGGWGTMTYGPRHPELFAAIYPDRPRVKYDASGTNVAVANWTGGGVESTPIASAPNLSAEDGGGSVAAYMDMIAYVSDTSKKIPWIGFNMGRQDTFVQFADMVAFVAALRAAKRGFAFAWNNGNHTTGSIQAQILSSYPFGTFEIGKGYPLFTEHSLDQDPSVDLVGKINCDLTFRNVVESASGWSCEVTSLAGPCTFKVEPISDIFKAPVAPQLVTIPAANSWVTVTFNA